MKKRMILMLAAVLVFVVLVGGVKARADPGWR